VSIYIAVCLCACNFILCVFFISEMKCLQRGTDWVFK
jgi:hypothetical protein